MKAIPALGETTSGIDIYHGDLIKDINKVKGAATFAFLKATEGVNTVDPKFSKRWAQMKTAGIVCGAYHFFHPGHDAVAQAEMFVNTVGFLGEGDLPCVMDWESTDGVPVAKDIAEGLKFLEVVEKATYKVPIVYSSPYFLQALSLTQPFIRYPLWIAHYGVKAPLIPDPWVDWSFWQHSETGSVPGMIGHCDLDVFNGSIAQLKAFSPFTKT